MHRVDTSTAVALLPAPEPAGTPGYFSKGDPGVGQSATVVGQDWFNAVQEELMYILDQAGIAPVKGTHTQLMAAIVKHITDRVAGFVPYPDAPEYINATQFRVPGDQTAKFHTNRRVRITDLTTFGETITAQAYDGGANKTLVTVTNNYGSLSNALTAVALGIGAPQKPLYAKEVQAFGQKSVFEALSAIMTVRDQKTSATDGGTFTSGARRTRDLNTIGVNNITGASLDSNQITLPAGTFFVLWRAPAYQVTSTRSWLRNVTDGADLLHGSTTKTAAGNDTQVDSVGFGLITLAAPKVLEIQHQCTTNQNTNGFGRSSGLDVEIYTAAYIIQLG